MYSYDQQEPEARETVHGLYYEPHDEAKKRGYGEYRGHVQHIDLIATVNSFNDHAYNKLVEKLGVTPNRIYMTQSIPMRFPGNKAPVPGDTAASEPPQPATLEETIVQRQTVMTLSLSSYVVLSLSTVLAGNWAKADSFIPTVSGTPQELGNVTDPTINRDSCVSARFGSRMLWTCRDSQPYDSNGTPILPVYSSSASWTDFNDTGTPTIQSTIQGSDSSQIGLLCYGDNNEQPFFPITTSECNDNSAGGCPDGTRYAIWPNSPPLMTFGDPSTGSVVAYTWILQSHITSNLALLDPDPPTTLYQINYNGTAGSLNSTELPSVVSVDDTFWKADQIPYGTYGGAVVNDTAYLYGMSTAGTIGLAQVPADQVSNQTAYQYYVNNAWTSIAPGVNDTGVDISNAGAGGQGTFYYSTIWDLFVWIGQAGESIAADFYITTAPAAEGPWAEPVKFYSGESNGMAYSLQANPGLVSDPNENAIYLSYTVSTDVGYYTPLVYVQWE
ncbi:hypothetical protein BGW36DRAFT_466710 [Talaromyces proteolyticus]|uniref:DUF4185 domain-containing protein n=1 Tax=Talaromyces proteolyticus TaxID=1131652 RepID=A0AAD4KD35_9EURO|nr:uncharacterized protein BGW36DRAFT_466710 [Talaromyces proteolyticus]KAH8689169.1 hypothetical protein BGW36DRAFT_466710 [Talaromyces proteolyticus]